MILIRLLHTALHKKRAYYQGDQRPNKLQNLPNLTSFQLKHIVLILINIKIDL